MAKFALPKPSRVVNGKTWPRPTAPNLRQFQVYRWTPDRGKNPRAELSSISGVPREPGRRQKSAHGHLFRRHGRLRSDGARRADLDKKSYRSNADLQALLSRGDLRLVLDEYRRSEHIGLHQINGRPEPRGTQDLYSATSSGGQRPCPLSYQLLRPVCVH